MPYYRHITIIAPWTTRAKLALAFFRYGLLLLSPWHAGAEMEVIVENDSTMTAHTDLRC